MLRVAIVGLGGIGGVHVLNWETVENAKLISACDVRPECFEKVEKLQIPVYTDMQKMIEEQKPDIVDICTPTYLHIENARLALGMGCNVILEKPISLSSKDIDGLYELAEQNHVKLMVAHVVRFWNEYVKLREIIQSGEYGKVLNAHFLRMGEVPRWSFENWMLDKSKSGLVPFDLHIHDLDFIVYTFGKPLSWEIKRCERNMSDYLFASYQYDDFFVHCEAAWIDGAYPFQCRFRVQFEKALVEAVGGIVNIYTPDGRIMNLEEETKAETGINLPSSNAYANELHYFADCVAKNHPIDMVPKEDLKIVLDILENM